MAARQRKSGRTVVKGRGCPSGCRMARHTVVIEVIRHMIRVGNAFEITLMARIAGS